MIIDFKTTGAGWLTFGLTVASFLVKDPATKTTLQQLAGATGAAGLMMAADSKGQPTQNTDRGTDSSSGGADASADHT